MFRPRPEPIERKPLDSSFLMSGGYHAPSQTLHLEFKDKSGNGKVLYYENVTPEKATQVLDAKDSHGSAYAKYIRPFYVGKPLAPVKQAEGSVKLSELQAEQQRAGAVGAIQRVMDRMAGK
jgi:hypothetical protein